MNCGACGDRIKVGTLCDKCAEVVVRSLQAKCPVCFKITHARCGVLNRIELDCGHSFTPMAMVGFVNSYGESVTSIKSKLETEP